MPSLRTKLRRYLPTPRSWWAPCFVLTVTLMLTCLVTFAAHHFIRARERARFDSAVEQTRQNIRRLMKGYLMVLDGTRGLVDAKVTLNRKQFYSYVDSLQLQKNYPGVQGQGVIMKVPVGGTEKFIASTKKQGGAADYHIWPESEGRIMAPVVYLAPENERNDKDIGFDMLSEPVRTDAIMRAIQSGQAAISKRVPPMSPDHAQENRFLIFLPVYWGGTVPPTPELRGRNILGCVYCPFQLDQFFASLLDSVTNESITFQVYDGTDPASSTLLHDSAMGKSGENAPLFTTTTILPVADSEWRMVFTAKPEFSRGSDKLAPIAFFGGGVFSLLLFMVTLTQTKARTTSEQFAASLKESEAEFRASFYSAAVGKAQVDPVTGRYIRVNLKFCEITGYTEEELRGMTFMELTYPEDRNDDHAAHQQMAEGAVPQISREKRYVRKDGGLAWVNVSTSMIRDIKGRPVRTLAVVQDVTARRQAVEALRTAELRFRTLVEQSIAGIYVIQDGRLAYVNPRMAKIFGYSVEEMTTMLVEDVISKDDRKLVADNIQRRLSGAVDSVQYLLRGICKDGTLIDVEVHGSLVEYLGGPAILGTLLDVTERRRSEERSQWLASFPERNPIPIVEVELKPGTLRYINPAARKLFPDLEVLGLAHPFLAGLLDLPPEAAPDDSGPLRREVAVGDRSFSQTLNFIPETGGLRIYGNDITARRRAEEELKTINTDLEQRVQNRTALLEDANKELESFSYSVSHDLRAPLRHIQGYVELLTAATAGKLSEKAGRYLQTITNASTEMAQLIDDLLAFSRMGRVGLTQGKVKLEVLIQEVIRSLERSLHGRSIEWKIATLPVVIGDAPMLKQVLANLLDNAVKYSRKQEAAVIEVGTAGEADGRTVFFVRDNGAGFDMKYAHKLFGVFQRLHRAEEFEGTGIGLATVRRIIVRHGGKTWAESEINRGSTFFFTLETEPAPQAPIAP